MEEFKVGDQVIITSKARLCYVTKGVINSKGTILTLTRVNNEPVAQVEVSGESWIVWTKYLKKL